MNIHTLASRILREGGVTLTGLRELMILRRAIHTLGVRVVYDPDSDAELVDYLGVAAVAGVEAAAVGAALGALAGALAGDVVRGALVGAVLVGAVGALHGVNNVEKGWRITVKRDSAGVARAVVAAL